MKDESQYSEYRDDGFPICPQCGEDELWSTAGDDWDGAGKYQKPTLEEYKAKIVGCYFCGWSPGMAVRRSDDEL